MKSTCSTTLRRTLGVAGFLIGFGLLSAGVASANEGDQPGLLGGVATLVAPVTDALAPVTHDVTAVTDPVVRPVLKSVAPVTEPVLAPLAPTVDTVVRTLGPVLEPLQPAAAPVLAPVARTVQDVPLVPQIVKPLVAQPSDRAAVPPPAAEQSMPEVPRAPAVVPETHAAALPGWVAAAVTPRQQQVYAPDVAPPVEAPQRQSPDVPFALPGTTGSASSNGSASQAVSDLPAGSGIRPHGESLVVNRDHQVHGSWCYYYGRNHPS
ncbi:hypothetical protein [Lentzea flaviverrucosa]|uniref:Uncharacterized protein n=1 Tax=Lentzea flaviverrucosa TaxID=200379 RepID=A0A1H9XSI4_9PSEU|nr:hypothetical protein [Lentzea flaviverrucosa]RDI19887.1 hypothetical protein DFR72_116249 [Lentzea flaviverrucosa]SES48653.1 hypothetical protein SAMN05216195_116248 [Lentzea flaviverrucosa]